MLKGENMSRYSRMEEPYWGKCGDCGGEIGERTVSSRRDICDTCWGNRGWLLANRELIGMAEFQKIQKSMASHRGTAKRRIDKLKV